MSNDFRDASMYYVQCVPQHLRSHDLTALYKSVIIIIIIVFLAH